MPTNHFRARMLERGISIDHVKKALREPDSKEDAFDGKLKVTKEIEGKTTVVVYFKEGFKDRKNEYVVSTAYYL